VWRLLSIAALLALSGCNHNAPQTAAPAPAVDARPATAPPVAPPAPPAQSETQEAAASQESLDASDSEQKASSDVSLERIAAGSSATASPPARWQAGVNYDVLAPAQPTNVPAGKVEVLEIFWLACPHCYTLEPYLRNWLKSKPGYIEFVRVPVYWQAEHRAHARLFYALTELGRPDLIAKAFDTIQQDLRNQVAPLYVTGDEAQTLRLQQQFAAQNGVSAQDFTRAYNSPAVSSGLSRADELALRYRVVQEPFFAVNGKYTTNLAKAGGEAQLMSLLNDLAAAEHAH
jgi:protein dithiol oxidoreductase (disulfide-forming)